jgi:hypothetical protein
MSIVNEQDGGILLILSLTLHRFTGTIYVGRDFGIAFQSRHAAVACGCLRYKNLLEPLKPDLVIGPTVF